jgi:hypothetical protein
MNSNENTSNSVHPNRQQLFDEREKVIKRLSEVDASIRLLFALRGRELLPEPMLNIKAG